MAKKTKRSTARRRPAGPAARSSGAPTTSAAPTRTAPPRVATPPREAAAEIEEEAAPAAFEGEPEAAPPTPLDVAPARGSSAAAAAASSPLRRVGRVDPATRRPRPAAPPIAQAAELDADDASIPLARVPYTTGDLRRVLMIGSLMVVLIIIATVLVTVLVK